MSTNNANQNIVLNHLRRIKPNDGWGIDHKDGLVRLSRRNVPLTDAYFFDLHHDQTGGGAVVGILSGVTRPDGTVQSQVLVDGSGKIICGRQVALLSVKKYTRTGRSYAFRESDPPNSSSSRRTRTTTQSTANNRRDGSLSDEQNRDILMYGMWAILAAVVYRVVVSQLAILLVFVVPLAYFYLLANCPTAESFDAKKELKRVLRGHHLPENHPEKPKGFLSETLARISATVATELATLPGYEIQMMDLGGAAVLAIARVPAVETEYYWVGAANKWWFVFGKSARNTTTS